jgi:hypothetical protein
MMLPRVAVLAAALLVSAASGGSQNHYAPPGPVGAGQYTPPPSEPMDASRAVGLFRSSFGPVRIEVDADQGLPAMHGVWVYDREQQEVVGYFAGRINGNVLEFDWQEPAQPEPLRGSGFLVFHSDGTGFYGKWWTTARDRSGDWTGQRFEPGQQDGAEPPPDEPPYDEPTDAVPDEA